jgi:tetratricopeptide (TPR) repeat protein
LDVYKAAAFFRYSRYYLNTSQNQRALNFNNQAISIASAIGSDSLLCLAYASIAGTWDGLANKLSKIQALLNERDFAEKSKIPYLIVRSYFHLGNFCESANDYEKAKDFYSLALEKGRQWHDEEEVFNSLRALGRTHLSQKNEKLGISYYTKAIGYMDMVGIEIWKLQIYLDLLNYYFNINDPVKGFAYMGGHPQLMEFIRKFGIEYQVNKQYAALESSRCKNDSALFYLRKAVPFEYGQKGNYGEKFQFTSQIAIVY